MPSMYTGKLLVHGNVRDKNDEYDVTYTTENNNNNGNDDDEKNIIISPLLYSDVSLSFWGGIDPETGIIIDKLHPLSGQCVTDTILCLPSGRGSCTASQVLLELILNKKAPKALILRDRDGLICVGAIIAQSIFPESIVLDIIQINNNDFSKLNNGTLGCIVQTEHNDGDNTSCCVIVGNNPEELKTHINELQMITPNQSRKSSSSSSSSSSFLDVKLTKEEQEMLDNAKTEAELRATQCLIRYGHIISDNPTYINVEKGHIDGCTYIGPGGLQFVQRLIEEGGAVSIPTTLNSVSTDLRYWDKLGIVPTQSQQASIELAKSYVKLGCSEESFTCAPYLLDDPPTIDQNIVWGESNAVVYANSMLGARTEKYADYLDICCSIVGKVPAVGVHLDKYRQPTVCIDVNTISFISSSTTTSSTDNINYDNISHTFSLLFPILGHLCGTLADGEVPILIGLERYSKDITIDHMKAFCAAFGTTGTSPLIHVAGITAEAKDPIQVTKLIDNCSRQCIVTIPQLEKTFNILNHTNDEEQKEGNDDTTTTKVDWIALGNPHLSLSECDMIYDIITSLPKSQQMKHDDVEIIACMSRVLYDQVSSHVIPTLHKFGIKFVNDTCWCMLLEPPMIPYDINATILTNSGKYAHYGPGLTGRKFRLGTMDDCIKAATTSILPNKQMITSSSSSSSMPWISTQKRSWSSVSYYNNSNNQIILTPRVIGSSSRFSRRNNMNTMKTQQQYNQTTTRTQWSKSCRFVLSRLLKK